ncbi:hypothetical protein RhiTH_010897 [Rhizoctonia solani]
MELEASKPILDNIDGLGYILDVGSGFNPRFLDFLKLSLEVLNLAEEAKEEGWLAEVGVPSLSDQKGTGLERMSGNGLPW